MQCICSKHQDCDLQAGGQNQQQQQQGGALVASYGGDSEEEDDEDQGVVVEAKLLDLSKMACLLCKRQFPNREALNRHTQLSDLHKVSCWYSHKNPNYKALNRSIVDWIFQLA